MAGPEWKFGVLGTLTLERDGSAVELRGGRPRALLALLLMSRGRPMSVDQLTTELWGDDMPASAQSALHVHLSKVRALLGDLMERSPAGYSLRPGAYELDADLFETLLHRAGREPGRARSLITDALDLWRGDVLNDLQSDGALAEWRRTLEERRLAGIEARVDADLADGAGGELVGELQQLVGEHPYEERLCGQLMLALYRAGRQAEALDTYGRARRRLADGLGLDPGQQLRRLHEQILNQDPSLLAESPGDSPAVAPATPSAIEPDDVTHTPRTRERSISLPQTSTRLIGRDAALLELEGLVDDPFCRLVTLTGLGGVGKTRLAIAHAARWGESFTDGVVFAGLARLTNASQVRAEIANAIARRRDATEPNEVTLVPYLKDRSLLMVLDNFEHVLGAADVVAELLAEAPSLKLLVTSRVPLQLRGEHRFEVEPLASDAHGDPTGGPAVEMFLQGALARNRRFDPPAAELATVAAICTALDGLPLAIELAAARTSVLSPAQIAAQLDTPLTIGRGELRDLPERHQTLEAAIGWSYDLLAAPARRVLRAASVFVGPFTPDGLTAVTGEDATEELYDLVNASLVQRSSVSGRFRLLDLVRIFARARLRECGETDPARTRHRQYLLTRFADVAAEEFPSTPAEVALEMAADHADIRVAIADAVQSGDREGAVTLAKALHSVWWIGQLEESGVTVDAILDAFALSPDDELRLLRMADDANGYRPTGEVWSRRRATRAAELGNVRNQVGALARLMVKAMNRRDPAAAIALRAELTQVLQDNPGLHPRSRGVALTALADCAYLQGDWAAANALSTEAVALAVSSVGITHSVTARRQLQLLATSAHLGWIEAAAVLAIVDGALTFQITDLGINALLPAARYAADFDADLARLWLANAERTLIEIGGVMGHDWQDETLLMLGIDDIAALLDSVPARPLFELLGEARDWLAARDPAERVARAVPATPLASPVHSNPV